MRQFVKTVLAVIGMLAVVVGAGVLTLRATALPKGNLQETTTFTEPTELSLDREDNQITQIKDASEEFEGGLFDVTEASAEEGEEVDLLCPEEDYVAPADNGCPYYVRVNREQNVVTIYALDEKGYYSVPIKAFLCSVGAKGATPTGTFYTSDRYRWRCLLGNVYGQYAYRIDGHIMFHSVPYYRMENDALETEEYNKLGTSVSMGCVRMTVSDVKWIYDNCPEGTMVTIYDSPYPGPLGRPVTERLDTEDERSGWDPTDPQEDNPWATEEPRILGAGVRRIERGYTYQPACGVIALDNRGKDITSRLEMTGYVNAMEAGAYPVTYSVEDDHGRKTTIESVIEVLDTQNPQLDVLTPEITLNRNEMSDRAVEEKAREAVIATDLGRIIPSDYISVDLTNLNQMESGRYSVQAVARDAVGNTSEPVEVTLIADVSAPEIKGPERREYTADSRLELVDQLMKDTEVTDDYSGVGEVKITWVYSGGSYHLLVTAKDLYGNVSTAFYDGFHFHGNFEQ